jgi:hypothetical protein
VTSTRYREARRAAAQSVPSVRERQNAERSPASKHVPNVCERLSTVTGGAYRKQAGVMSLCNKYTVKRAQTTVFLQTAVMAPAAAASWRAHDGRRQRGTACPLHYRYCLTYTYCSLARLPPTHPFVGAPILQRHFQIQWRARLPPPRVLFPHTCTQDGWFLQPKRRPARLPRRTVPSNCICRCSRMRARLSPPRVLLPHTCTQDGWFLQPKRRPARLPRRTVPSNCICRCSRMRARLPLHILLLHTQVSR